MSTVAEFAAELGLDFDPKEFAQATAAIEQLGRALIAMGIHAEGATENTKKALETISLEFDKVGEHAEGAENKVGEKFLDHVKELFAAYLGFEGFKRLKESVDQTVELGAAVGDLADKTGTSVEEIQKLGYAAEINGLSTEFMANTLAHLSVSLAAAGHGSTEQAQAFDRAGIKIRDSAGKIRPASEVLNDIADHIKSLDEADRPAAAFELLGKQGKELIPLFKNGSKGLNDFKQEAEDMGLVLDKETVEAMDKVEKSTKRLGLSWKGLKQEAIASLIPKIQDLVQGMLDWMKANRESIKQAIHAAFNLVVVAVKALAVGLKVVTTVTAWFIKNWPIMIALLAGMAGAFLILKEDAILAAIDTAIAWAIAAAPFVLIAALIAAIILVVEDLYMAFTGGDSVFKDLYDAVEEWLGDKITDLMDGTIGDIIRVFGDLFSEIWREIKMVGHAIEWVIDRIEDAIKAAQSLLGSVDINGMSDRMQKVGSLGLTGEAAEKYVATGELPPAMSGGPTVMPALSASDMRAVQATANVTNNFTINGDPDTVRRVVREEQATTARHLESTLGGAKAKR